MSFSIDDIAGNAGTAWKPEVGDMVKGTVLYVSSQVRTSNFSGLDEESMRVDLDTGNGEVVSVYATKCTDTSIDPATGKPRGYAKKDARAIAAAVRAAGSTAIENGATLAIKRVADVPSKLGAAKAYVAEYKPPTPALVVDEVAADGATTGLID